MPDNKQLLRQHINNRISIYESNELEAWAKKLNVEASEIRIAVGQVGTNAKKVQMYLEDVKANRDKVF